MVLFSLTFVRHGETMHNRKHIIQGQSDVPLSKLGEKQAQLVAERLKNDRFTHVFSSDLSRAQNTAKAIADANRVCKCDIVLDKRLRERRFGTAEGRTFKELLQATKKSKKRYLDYTPQGGESVAQVQERVQSFFKDLCTLCTSLSKCDERTYAPAKIKRRHGGSLGRNSAHAKCLQISGRSHSFCGSGNVQDFISEVDQTVDVEEDFENDIVNLKCGQHTRSDSLQDSDGSDIIKNVAEDFSYRECLSSGSEDSDIGSDDRIKNRRVTYNRNGIEVEQQTNSTCSCPVEITGSESKDPDNGNIFQVDDCENKPCLKQVIRYQSPVLCHTIDVSSREHCFCPEVPVSRSAQRLSSISSISSGKSSSFDDCTDSLPSTLADVLVVSHGGFIKETMRYFVETLDCKIPIMKNHALKVCPNCSISKFTITLSEDSFKPTLNCITIHDKDHLVGLDYMDANEKY